MKIILAMNLLNILLIVAVLILLVLSFWSILPGAPAAWKEAVRGKMIPAGIRRMAWFYPDKIRFYNWWIQAERLRKMKIEGSFAELGVYKGDSARIIHRLDPSRKFHLFDTFTGFESRDLSGETGEAASYQPSSFADTYINKVLHRIGGNDNIIPHQGYFPDTASGLTGERFALVNIDADLYNPTKAGLEFFYPRLVPGGVIFIHDYNQKWEGVLRAVDEFSATIPEVPVLLPDKEGTILIIKSEVPK